MSIFSSPNSKGFTLVEIIIAIAIIVTLASIVALNLGTFRETQGISNATDEIIALVNQARARTLAADGGTNYGVHFGVQDAVLFAGSSYTPGTTGNITVTLDPSVELDAVSLAGGGQDVIFDMLTGETEEYGTVAIRRLPDTVGEKTLTIEKTGAISQN